jgi:release factor glutamine methyltransferase
MRAAIAHIRKELAKIYSKEEIESLIFLIFGKLKGYSRTRFLLAYDELLSAAEVTAIELIVGRLLKHEPIQYVLGETEFYGLKFYTGPGVLIPRPETEELVQWMIQENRLAQPKILDIGTGSGCIAISMKKFISGSEVLACDISPVCIEYAQRNAALNSVQLEFVELDILDISSDFGSRKFDLIVSNPPYIRESEKQLMEKNVVDFEPETALFVPDADPLKYYSGIADFALLHLNPSGCLYFEINEAFGNECIEMLLRKGFSLTSIKKDIHGKDRMVRAYR